MKGTAGEVLVGKTVMIPHADLRIRGLYEPANLKGLRRRDRSEITHAVLHRAGWPNEPCTAEDLASRLMQHWPARRWPYHYFVERDGTIVDILPHTVVGNHAARHLLHNFSKMNTRSLGVGVDGDFRVEYPTQEQLTSVRYLGQMLRQAYPTIRMVGHDDVRWKPKHCPGQHADRLLGEFQGL